MKTKDNELKGEFFRGPTFVNGEIYACKPGDDKSAGFIALAEKARHRETLESELTGITSLMRGHSGTD